MHYTIAQVLLQARLADLHRQAQRAELVRAARQARHARGRPSGTPAPAVLAAVTAWARRLRPAAESS